MAIQPYAEEQDAATNPQQAKEHTAKRIRWATQKASKQKGIKKRASILGRLSSKRAANRDSTAHSLDSVKEEADIERTKTQGPGRKLFFNVPLPEDSRDEDGIPLAQYPRNKIRTAKYTPISFVPKNLWFQLHNVANIYFIFIVILGVSIFAAVALCHV